jgi:MFS family permease
MRARCPKRVGLAVASLCLVQYVDVLGVTVVVTSLPAMLADLGAPASASSLVATGYAMFFGGLLMLGARLGDRVGHRRIILASLAVFAVAAFVGATATSVGALTVARSLQGAAAAASVPSALRLLTTMTTAGVQRDRAIAVWSAAGAAAGASGFVVGGIATDLASWRVVFWAYLPLAGALAVVIARSVPRDRNQDGSISLNLAGSGLFTATAMGIVVGAALVTESGTGRAGAVLLCASLILAVLFVWVDRRAASPLLPRAVLRLPQLRQGALAGFLNTLTTTSVITLATLYLQDTLGRSPVAAAAMLLPFSLAVITGSTIAAATLRRVRPQRVVAVGLAAIGGADLVLIWAAPSPWALPMCLATAGAGIGLSSVAATGLGTDVDRAWRGTASGIINTAAQLGTALGIAALLLVAATTARTPGPGVPVPALAWALAAAFALAGAAAFTFTGSRSAPRAEPPHLDRAADIDHAPAAG